MKPLDKAIPVTHPALTTGDGNRYILGEAKTELGARRILNHHGLALPTIKAAIVVHLGHPRGLKVWEPK